MAERIVLGGKLSACFVMAFDTRSMRRCRARCRRDRFSRVVAETQDGKTLDNEIEVVEGMKFDRGYISPYFVTDNKTQMCEMENPIILIVEKKVRAVACAIGALPPPSLSRSSS